MSFKQVRPLMEGPVGEADPHFRKRASEAEKRAVRIANQSANLTQEEAAKALGLKEKIRAKYKVEITFGAGRTMQGPNIVGIRVWESGKRFHGGGDDLAFWCLEAGSGPLGSLPTAGCGAVIVSDFIKGGIAVCPNCKKAIKAEALTDIKVGRMTSQKIAEALATHFRQLGSNADIYLKYHPQDIRVLAMQREKGMEAARRLKGMQIYPLQNILTDTANGADVTKRFYAFITS